MLGGRLKLARARAGLSLRDLAERMDPPVSAQALSKYENDAMMPSSRVLLGLSRALNAPMDFLMGAQVAALSGVEFRKGAGTSAADRARVEAIVIERLENYLAIEEIIGLPSDSPVLKGIGGEVLTSVYEIDALAVEVRKEWSLGEDAIPSVTQLLEDRGVRVIEASLSEKVSGMTCSVERHDGRPSVTAIVVSNEITLERRRFTLAHELAHRLIPSVGGDLSLEKSMNRFAGAFLVPAEHLKREIGDRRANVSYHEIVRLKHMYGVSAAMLLYRLAQTGILDQSIVDNAFRTYARGWRWAEPDELPRHGDLADMERPARYESYVYRALAEGLISSIRAAKMLGVSLPVVEHGLRGPAAA